MNDSTDMNSGIHSKNEKNKKHSENNTKINKQKNDSYYSNKNWTSLLHLSLHKNNLSIQNNTKSKELTNRLSSQLSYYDSDSPITMDSEDEDDEMNSDWEQINKKKISSSSNENIEGNKKSQYSKDNLDLFYENDKYSNQIDILITFLKGQTHLYSISEYLTQQKINYLTIPSFLFSIVVTILATLSKLYINSLYRVN